MFKLFISRYILNKKQLYELLIQFAPIKDFYYTPKFCLVSFYTQEDLIYAKEMLKTIRKLKVEDSTEGVRVRIKKILMSSKVIEKIFSKFGSVRMHKDFLIFKKKEAAEKAVEKCQGKYIGYEKVEMNLIDEHLDA